MWSDLASPANTPDTVIQQAIAPRDAGWRCDVLRECNRCDEHHKNANQQPYSASPSVFPEKGHGPALSPPSHHDAQ
jgi:hypothetical protein